MKRMLSLALFFIASGLHAAENYQEYKLLFLTNAEKKSVDVSAELYDFIRPFKGVHAELCNITNQEPGGEYWERDGVRVTSPARQTPLYTASNDECTLYLNNELALPCTIAIKLHAVSEQAAYNVAREAILSLKETKKYMASACLAKKTNGQYHSHMQNLDLETGLLVEQE